MADPLPFALDRFVAKPALHAPCPKCDGKGVDVRYCTSEHVGQVMVEFYADQTEHLDLTCQWCGYIRYMVTKDARVSPVQERNVTA